MSKIAEFKDKYFFLSNFYPCDVLYKDRKYRSAEHAYQAAKTDDAEWFFEIINATTPGKAKYVGSCVPLREGWEELKTEVMLGVVRAKFANPELRKLLLDTEDSELQEGNRWHDAYWGWDLKARKGENMLGKILMCVRNELREECQ